MLSFEYIAGLFDGEGSVRITKSGGAYSYHPSSIDVRIGQNIEHNVVLHEICAMFGGTVCEYPNGYSQWIATTTKGASFLKAIEPYLRIKLEEAILVIQYQTYLDSQHQVRGKRLTPWQEAERFSYYEALMSNRYDDDWLTHSPEVN